MGTTTTWYDSYETFTLEEILEKKETWEYFNIEYDDWSEPEDLFIKWEIINPSNEQKLLYAWVPVDMVADLENEKETSTHTGRYCDMSSNMLSDLNASLEGIEEEKEAQEIVDEYNKKLIEHTSKYGECLSCWMRFELWRQIDRYTVDVV